MTQHQTPAHAAAPTGKRKKVMGYLAVVKIFIPCDPSDAAAVAKVKEDIDGIHAELPPNATVTYLKRDWDKQ